jgi:hypothetical protein
VAQRDLTDSRGRRWTVWEVRPEFAERRQQRGEAPVIERRVHHAYRVPLRTPWNNGWLAFENVSEKRRLAPYPADWESLSDRELEDLCEGATTILARPTPRLIE